MLALSVGRKKTPSFLYAVNTRTVRMGGFSLQAELGATLYLEQTESGGYTLENQGEDGVEVCLIGLPLESPVVYTLDATFKRCAEVPGTLAGARLTFSADPNTRYEIAGQ